MKTLDDKISSLTKDRQERIKTMASMEIAKLRLERLRESRDIPQRDIADAVGVSKSAISQLESRKKIGLEALIKYVAATGGRLEIRAVYPDATEVIL